MNTNKILGFLALLILAATLANAQVLPLTVDNVEIDDTDILPNQTNRLDVERGDVYDVEVKITALADVDDVELEAFISGYEYNDIERVSDTTHTFDADAGVTYVKKLKVTIPDDVEEDDYKLRVIISDRNSDPIVMQYNLKLDVPRHAVRIDDIVISPSKVEAGKAILATVRVENKGEKRQDDVRVTISIPELGVSGIDYIEQIDEEDEEETEEIFVKVPSNAKSGRYLVKVDVQFDELHRTLSESREIEIVGSAQDDVNTQAQPKTVIQLGNTDGAAVAGQGSAMYSFTVTNNDKNAKVYAISLDNADWADVKVLPASAAIVRGGESQVFTVQVTPAKGIEGTKTLTLNVKQGSQVVQQIPLTLRASRASMSWGEVAKYTLATMLVVFVVVLVLLGLVLAFRKMNDDQDLNTAETYY